MLLFYDIVPDAVAEHDDWHTHEHFPERVGIPGFLRASRWVAAGDGLRYFVMYEVEKVDVLSDAPYLQRLNNPTPWTSKMMPSFRGMTRGFCRLTESAGAGLGNALRTIRISPLAGRESELRAWLAKTLPVIASSRGLIGAHLFEPAAQPPMTKEQAIRGKDAEMPWVVVVTGYDENAVARSVETELAEAGIAGHGGIPERIRGSYRLHGLLADAERGGD
jgi:hypothetical protein